MNESFPIADLALLLPRAAEVECPAEEEVLHLFDTLRTSLLRYATSFGLATQDAEDILQEVFLALFHHLHRGRPRHNLHGWLFRVTHNLALKRRTRLGRQLTLSDAAIFSEDVADGALSPEAQLLLVERRRRLLAVFRALPERDRQCLQLRAEGLPYREIARVLDISLGSVSAVIARSLARIARAENAERRS
jgi:RNA polymerase sigma-70 factor (ECF subfamily)